MGPLLVPTKCTTTVRRPPAAQSHTSIRTSEASFTVSAGWIISSPQLFISVLVLGWDRAFVAVRYTGKQPRSPVTTDQSRRTTVPPRLLVCVALLAFITGLAYFLYFGPTYQPDSPSYIVPAKNLLNGSGLMDARGHPDTVRTPGYPLFLAPFLRVGLDLKYLVLFQHLLRILLIVAATAVAFSLTGKFRPAIIAGVLLCIDLPMLAAANSVLTEMLFTVILAVALWLLWRDSERPERWWSYFLLCAFLCGLSVLVRPISLFIFVPAGAYLLLTRKAHKWRAAISFTLAFSVLPLSWATRNYVRSGYFTLSTISGYNLLVYRAAGALAIEDPGKFATNLQLRSEELQAQACQDLTQIYHRDCSQLAFPVA